MADSMCGPSNAAKGLVSHADRDRSLHQDRLTGPPQPGHSSFRTRTAPHPNADGAFDAFQQGAEPSSILGPPMSGMSLENGRGMSTSEPPIAGPGPMARSSPFHPPLGGGGGPAFDAAGFQDFLRTRPDPIRSEATPSAPVINGMLPATSTMPYHTHMTPALPSSQHMTPGPMYGVDGGITGLGYGAHRPAAATAPFGTANLFSSDTGRTAAPQVNPMFSDEAFNAAFGEYDDADFDREIDAWIAEHDGGQTGQQNRVTEPPTSEEMAVIDANLEDLAEELEARRAAGDPAVLPQKGPEAEARKARQDQEDLVRAATEILVSVSDNESDKFKNSSFLDLMRRIQKMEIVVSGNDLVDPKTGEAIVSPTEADNHLHHDPVSIADTEYKGEDRATSIAASGPG